MKYVEDRICTERLDVFLGSNKGKGYQNPGPEVDPHCKLEKPFPQFSTQDDKKSALLSSLENLEDNSQGSLIRLNASPSTPNSVTNVENITAWKAFERLIARRGLQDEMLSVGKALYNQNCKNPLKSSAWIKDKTFPPFIENDNVPPCELSMQSTFGMGMTLWGNMQAIDIINIKHNEEMESIRSRDLSIFGGPSKSICRNLMILSVLSIISDIDEAAQYALHYLNLRKAT
ncbi:hypothetical protein IW261DRAFT_1426698 [Armillaria novae-zelandiae]|uniref:Uncharacterized protein n=1 Tax=Armillaria novae-zelandiae TaxID=153914 RepID=A0AA39NJA0_9AGAR|nr:hypothetical protein IW261DRAFT_1426698 [Armillaria novae-zelandiae]